VTTFDELHVSNPYLHLLDTPPTPDTFSLAWGQRVQLVYRWSYRAEALADARAALNGVKAAFDAEVEERKARWAEIRHHDSHKKEAAIHRGWLERRNSILDGRLAAARQQVAEGEARLREVEEALEELVLMSEFKDGVR
jgi:hypothetical protein